MNLGKISIRYTRALYSLAVENGSEVKIYEQMKLLSQVFFAVPNMTQALSNPMYIAKEKESLLCNAIGPDIDPLLKKFFYFVINKGRENLMVFMAMSYQDLYRKEKHIVEGNITSAMEMSMSTVSKIKQWISDTYNSELYLSENVDKELIGGFVLEVNNYRFDASVKTKLKEVQNKLIN